MHADSRRIGARKKKKASPRPLERDIPIAAPSPLADCSVVAQFLGDGGRIEVGTAAGIRSCCGDVIAQASSQRCCCFAQSSPMNVPTVTAGHSRAPSSSPSSSSLASRLAYVLLFVSSIGLFCLICFTPAFLQARCSSPSPSSSFAEDSESMEAEINTSLSLPSTRTTLLANENILRRILRAEERREDEAERSRLSHKSGGFNSKRPLGVARPAASITLRSADTCDPLLVGGSAVEGTTRRSYIPLCTVRWPRGPSGSAGSSPSSLAGMAANARLLAENGLSPITPGSASLAGSFVPAEGLEGSNVHCLSRGASAAGDGNGNPDAVPLLRRFPWLQYYVCSGGGQYGAFAGDISPVVGDGGAVADRQDIGPSDSDRQYAAASGVFGDRAAQFVKDGHVNQGAAKDAPRLPVNTANFSNDSPPRLFSVCKDTLVLDDIVASTSSNHHQTPSSTGSALLVPIQNAALTDPVVAAGGDDGILPLIRRRVTRRVKAFRRYYKTLFDQAEQWAAADHGSSGQPQQRSDGHHPNSARPSKEKRRRYFSTLSAPSVPRRQLGTRGSWRVLKDTGGSAAEGGHHWSMAEVDGEDSSSSLNSGTADNAAFHAALLNGLAQSGTAVGALTATVHGWQNFSSRAAGGNKGQRPSKALPTVQSLSAVASDAVRAMMSVTASPKEAPAPSSSAQPPQPPPPPPPPKRVEILFVGDSVTRYAFCATYRWLKASLSAQLSSASSSPSQPRAVGGVSRESLFQSASAAAASQCPAHLLSSEPFITRQFEAELSPENSIENILRSAKRFVVGLNQGGGRAKAAEATTNSAKGAEEDWSLVDDSQVGTDGIPSSQHHERRQAVVISMAFFSSPYFGEDLATHIYFKPGFGIENVLRRYYPPHPTPSSSTNNSSPASSPTPSSSSPSTSTHHEVAPLPSIVFVGRGMWDAVRFATGAVDSRLFMSPSQLSMGVVGAATALSSSSSSSSTGPPSSASSSSPRSAPSSPSASDASSSSLNASHNPTLAANALLFERIFAEGIVALSALFPPSTALILIGLQHVLPPKMHRNVMYTLCTCPSAEGYWRKRVHAAGRLYNGFAAALREESSSLSADAAKRRKMLAKSTAEGHSAAAMFGGGLQPLAYLDFNDLAHTMSPYNFHRKDGIHILHPQLGLFTLLHLADVGIRSAGRGGAPLLEPQPSPSSSSSAASSAYAHVPPALSPKALWALLFIGADPILDTKALQSAFVGGGGGGGVLKPNRKGPKKKSNMQYALANSGSNVKSDRAKGASDHDALFSENVDDDDAQDHSDRAEKDQLLSHGGNVQPRALLRPIGLHFLEINAAEHSRQQKVGEPKLISPSSSSSSLPSLPRSWPLNHAPSCATVAAQYAQRSSVGIRGGFVAAQLNVFLSAIPPQITFSDAEAKEQRQPLGGGVGSGAVDNQQQQSSADYVPVLGELQRYAITRRAIVAAYSPSAHGQKPATAAAAEGSRRTTAAFRRVFDVLSPLSAPFPPLGEADEECPPAASLQKVLAERAVLAEALARVVLRPAADAVLKLRRGTAKQTQTQRGPYGDANSSSPFCVMSAIDLNCMSVASPSSQPQLSFALNLVRAFTGVSKSAPVGESSAARHHLFPSVGFLRTCYYDAASNIGTDTTTTDLPAMDVFIDAELVLSHLRGAPFLDKERATTTVRASAELFVVQLERLIATALTELTASQLGQPADGSYLLHG